VKQNGGPGPGDEGVIGQADKHAGFVVECSQTQLRSGVELILTGDSVLSQPEAQVIWLGGTFTFNDQSAMVQTQIELADNTELNWFSNGTFSPGTLEAALPVFSVMAENNNKDTVVNMTSGLWDLHTTAKSVGFRMNTGKFNMSGGTVQVNRQFQLGGDAVFNLNGDAEVYADSWGLFGKSTLNFESRDAAFFLKGDDGLSALEKEIKQGKNLQIDGKVAQDVDDFSIEACKDESEAYTRIKIK